MQKHFTVRKMMSQGLESLPLDLRREIYDDLTIGDLKHLAATNKYHAGDVANNLRSRVNRLFAHFGLDPTQLLKLMKQYGVVVSGSTVLLVILTWSFVPGDLDFYVTRAEATSFVHKLQESFGVKAIRGPDDFDDNRDDIEYWPMSCVSAVYHLELGKHTIQVIATDSSLDNASDIIYRFHSSPVMNYISHDTIFCAYPHKTLKFKGVRNFSSRWYTRDQKLALQAALEKYIERGFEYSGDCGLWPRYWGEELQFGRRKHPLMHLFT